MGLQESLKADAELQKDLKDRCREQADKTERMEGEMATQAKAMDLLRADYDKLQVEVSRLRVEKEALEKQVASGDAAVEELEQEKKSLIQEMAGTFEEGRPKTFAEIRRRAVEHIASEGETYEKCTTATPARLKAQIRTQPVRVHQATTERKHSERKRAYEPRRTQPRGRAEERREGNRPPRQNFVMELKDLIVVPNIVDRLRPPVKSDKALGPHKESWCEFHEAFGHHINNCLALGHQLDELVKNGFLKDYLVER
ncbi:uncharacterized protein [Phaseolus vulgaris]|uniref:uncharacterized protein n=1 Tax=Phaseolus vulgaris TaxID=3885 RepID=UPI0035CAD86E